MFQACAEAFACDHMPHMPKPGFSKRFYGFLYDNMKYIKFLKLLKNANYIYKKKNQNMLKEIFTSVPKYLILHKEKK